MTINPDAGEFDDVPSSASADFGRTFGERSASEKAGDAWEQTKEKAGRAAEQTQLFLRENPVPTLLGALALGIGIGLAIRMATAPEEPEPRITDKVSDAAWSFLSLPFIWPLVKSVREKAEDSADAVKEGVDRLKKVKVAKYTKPVKKRWKAWTS